MSAGFYPWWYLNECWFISGFFSVFPYTVTIKSVHVAELISCADFCQESICNRAFHFYICSISLLLTFNCSLWSTYVVVSIVSIPDNRTGLVRQGRIWIWNIPHLNFWSLWEEFYSSRVSWSRYVPVAVSPLQIVQYSTQGTYSNSFLFLKTSL